MKFYVDGLLLVTDMNYGLPENYTIPAWTYAGLSNPNIRGEITLKNQTSGRPGLQRTRHPSCCQKRTPQTVLADGLGTKMRTGRTDATDRESTWRTGRAGRTRRTGRADILAGSLCDGVDVSDSILVCESFLA